MWKCIHMHMCMCTAAVTCKKAKPWAIAILYRKGSHHVGHGRARALRREGEQHNHEQHNEIDTCVAKEGEEVKEQPLYRGGEAGGGEQTSQTSLAG